MRAMRLHASRSRLELEDESSPAPGPGEIMLKVKACGVCRTDLHIVDGELEGGRLPIVPGHEIVGTVVGRGEGARRFSEGERVGVPWLGWTCGRCDYCRAGRENLCEAARFTGFHRDGGYAEYALADERFCFALPSSFGDTEAAPLLCAGLIGYRCLRAAGEARRIGFYGFGSSAQILAQVANAEGREVYAFTRDGDSAGQQFARSMGAAWAGGSGEAPPEPLDAAIIFAPVGPLVVTALRNIVKGGVVVCAGIHMSEIPSFPYELLWGERSIRSVANLTRSDGQEFFALKTHIKTQRQVFPLERANDALNALRAGEIVGTAILVPSAGYRAPR